LYKRWSFEFMHRLVDRSSIAGSSCFYRLPDKVNRVRASAEVFSRKC
jgi:hypothetical protein